MMTIEKKNKTKTKHYRMEHDNRLKMVILPMNMKIEMSFGCLKDKNGHRGCRFFFDQFNFKNFPHFFNDLLCICVGPKTMHKTGFQNF